jgi:Ca2+-binding EF-hand superfamily protein
MMDFSVDDNSYRSAQGAADFTGLVQIALGDKSGVEWVERTQIKRIREELELSTVAGLADMRSLRQGKLAKADWMITGQFSVDDRNRRTLYLEITSLQEADVLASRTITFPDALAEGASVNTYQVGLAVTNMRQLLGEAKAKSVERIGRILIAPLFFADVTGWGAGFARSESFANLDQAFFDSLERGVAGKTNIQLVRFPKAYRSLDESEMVLDGLTDTSQDTWHQTADLYVWGTYVATHKFNRGQPPTETLEITVHFWDGISPPVQLTEKLQAAARPAEVQASLDRLAKEVIAHGKPATGTGTRSMRRDIAQSMVDAYDQMTLRPPHDRRDLQLDGSGNFLQAAHMLETACFFDPDNAKARLLYITCRWGWWMDFTFHVKNEFWSKWRRSQAMADYVDRFGLDPVDIILPFPYQQQGGIPNMYVHSLEDALEQFPGWQSVEQARSEDEDRRQGVTTQLMGAELHGFPKEMPHDLAWEWKIAKEAELARRKKMVADFEVAHAKGTNISNVASNGVAQGPTAKTGVANLTKPPEKSRASVITQVLSQMVDPPPWVKEFGPTFSFFRLFPPSALPLEVKPDVREIKFPTQFEVQSILQMGFLEDKLLILAMDERSTQSSDTKAETSTELLDKHNRLWVMDSGATIPVLYRPDLFPQSVSSYLVVDGRLWFGGKTTGYLDLKTGKLRKFGLADGFTLQSSAALGSAGGKIFAAGDFFKICSVDVVTESWTNVPLQLGTLSGSSAFLGTMCGQGDWVAYAAGSVLIGDVAHNSWTNLSEMESVGNVTADENGFWFGNGEGLNFFETGNQSLKKWHSPGMIQGMTLWGAYYNGNPKISQREMDQISEGAQGFLRKLQKDRAKTQADKLNGREVDPLNLHSRVPGKVTAVANDGDFLWFGSETYFGDYLLLLHKPSASLVARFNMPVRGHISSIAVSKTNLWVGTAYGDQQLLQISKDAFLSVPRNQWMSLALSPGEKAGVIGSMKTRDQAMYAFYDADDERVAKVLGGINPAKATLEEMFLLAFSYDASGLDQPELARSWFERIIARDPKSPWAKGAQQALAANVENHRTKAHGAALLQRYDRNHDGVLDEKETALMKKDPTYQREQQAFDEADLEVQIKAIFERYDANKDGKLDSGELESLVNVVRLYVEAPPEMIRGRKILVAPLLTKDFPAAPALLKKYDVGHDGTLNLDELRTLAKEIKRNAQIHASDRRIARGG